MSRPFPSLSTADTRAQLEPTPIPGGRAISSVERRQLTAYLEAFRLHLSDADPPSVPVFNSGYRLSPSARAALMASLTPSDVSERGLRFVDPPVSPPPFPADLHSQAFIADLWSFADPLQLDLIADVRHQGMHLAFNPPTTLEELAAAPRRPNVAKPGSPEMAIILEKVKADIAAGKAIGPFASRPPNAIAIPLFLTDKGDVPDPHFTDADRHRLVRNWSDARLTKFGSITAHTDAPTSSMSPFRAAFADFARLCALPATTDAHALSFDQEDAYAQLRIAPGQSHLMSSHIPGFGWFVRTVGDFGHRTCGIRFEQRAKLFALACLVLSPFLRVHDDGRVVLLHSFGDVSLGPHPEEGFGSLARHKPLFSPAGWRRHLRNQARVHHLEEGWHRVDLSPLHRWVDDFVGWAPDPPTAVRTAQAVAFLHRRYNFNLKPSKFLLGRQADFGGVTMVGPAAAMVLPDPKRSRYTLRLAHALAAPALSHNQWERVIGPPAWVARVFDTHTSALQPLFVEMGKARARSSPLPTTPRSRRALAFWLEAIKLAPGTIAATQFTDPRSPSSWDGVVHIDWAPVDSEQVVGVYVISHALYSIAPIPKWFLDAFPQSPHPSSPACEAMGLYLFLSIFADLVQGRTFAIFNDNISWLLCYPSLSSESQALDCALKLAALTALSTATRLVPLFVPTDSNLADPASRRLEQVFLTALRSKGLSRPSFRQPKPFAQPPFWSRLLRH